MLDRDVVAAVVAGDADGIAEAYDRYAASLAAYCHSMLPGPEAAEVVQDTFLIAVSRLDGLRDPDRLNAWLYAVARNECLRRLCPQGSGSRGTLVGGATAATWAAGSPDPDDLPAATLPAELRGQVLAACADNSPAGRAHRVSVAHRAGAFGPSGFPRAVGAAGPRWWQRVRRRPRPVAVLAAVVAVAAAAVIIIIVTAGGPHPSQASALGFGAGPVGATPGSATPGSASAASSPTHKPAASARPSAPPVTTPASPPSPVRPSMMVTVRTARPSPSRTSPSAPPSPSPSPTPSPSTAPAPGHLLAVPASLALTSAAGKAVSGTFLLTAVGGPVSEYTITVPATAGKITVGPAQGSLPASGYVSVTVTVTSKVALSTAITVQPGDLTVRVTLKIKA